MEKTMKARVQHKHDIEANWLKATNFIPLASEIIVYDLDENYDYPRIKIGDGKTNINSLPFVTKDYAKISDIPTKPEDIGALPDSTVIPTVPTKISAFENDKGYLTQHQSLDAYAKTADLGALATKDSLTASDVGALPDTTKIPSALSDLTEDSTHRTVTDTEKNAWNAKSNFSGNYADLNGKPAIPTVPTKISAFENDAGYLTEHQSLEGLATEEWVEEKFEEHSGFVAQPEAPEDTSVLWLDTDDDSADSGGNAEDGFSPIATVEQTATGAVISITDKTGTTTATITNGKDGKDGANGKDGSPGADGITPHVGSNGNWFIGATDTGIPATGPAGGQGLPGAPGEDGKDGTSVNHSWNGTVLTVTSASGTSSADLKGAKGDKGDKGDTGAQGPKGDTGSKGDKGDTGATGAAGKDGADGLPGADGAPGEDGKTPVRGVDYYTDADKAEFETYIATELAKRGQLEPLYANSIEECTDTSKLYVLPDGFIYAYTMTEVESGPSYTNLLLQAVNSDGTPYVGDNGEKGYRVGYRVNSSGAEVASTAHTVTGFIPAKTGDIIRTKGFKKNTAQGNNIIQHYKADFTKYGSPGYPDDYSNFTVGGDATTAYIRIAVGTISSDAVVTVNEEITESGGTSTEYAWKSTGLAFIPANYEGRIIDLEQDSKEHAMKISALEKAVTSGGADNTETQALTRIKEWDKPVYDPAPVTLIADSRVKPALTTSDRTIDGIYAKYRALMAAHPKYITETNMGKCTASGTFTAVDMLRFDFKEQEGLTDADYNSAKVHETKPKIIFMSGVHNEWVGVWGLYYALEEIATNPDFDDVRRNAHIIVIPCANPYGLVKPLGEYETPSHVNANGVAIHNNFGVNHSTSGTAGEYNYGGTNPYSELETQYIDAVMAENPDAVAFVSCHNNDYSTMFGAPVIWASSATYHMCNMAFRLIDKLSKAWLDKYGDTLKEAIDTYKINMDDGDYRLGRAMMSSSKGTEQLNATKYGIQATNLEISRMMKVFSGDTDGTSEVMTHGAEVYANFMRTLLWSYDHKDKKEYAPNLPWK